VVLKSTVSFEVHVFTARWSDVSKYLLACGVTEKRSKPVYGEQIKE
jgi:hypothetical protein